TFERNNGGNAHQSVNVNNDKHVANIDTNNGWNSWNSVWDYGNGYMATRILSKKTCIVAQMNRDVMPDITVLPQVAKGKKGRPPKELHYTVSKTKLTDLTPYGKSVEAMCRGIPTYLATEMHGANFFYFSQSCFRADILFILGIQFCGEVVY
uniref:Gastrokine-1 n=1 Tax=Sphenodon punctatus TaxID=8508 RepID=A0A8D0GU16_SPHPU